MRKATKASIAAQAKNVENRVARYLWGDDHLRDWKEDHDVSGPDYCGRTWFVEVKNWAWPAGPKRLWTILDEALTQARSYTDGGPGLEYSCSVLVPPRTQIEDALVMYVDYGIPGIITLRQFKETVLCV